MWAWGGRCERFLHSIFWMKPLFWDWFSMEKDPPMTKTSTNVWKSRFSKNNLITHFVYDYCISVIFPRFGVQILISIFSWNFPRFRLVTGWISMMWVCVFVCVYVCGGVSACVCVSELTTQCSKLWASCMNIQCYIAWKVDYDIAQWIEALF